MEQSKIYNGFVRLCALVLALLIALFSFTSCDLSSFLGNRDNGDADGNGETDDNGENTDDDGETDDNGEEEDELLRIEPVVYGSEYKHTLGDMDVDTRLSLGKADVITDKHLIFSANITSFEGVRVGHGYEDYTSAYLVIDDTYITHYWYVNKQETKLHQYKHKLDIKGYIKVSIDVDSNRFATIVLETNNNILTLKWNNWYGSNGDIFAESIGSVMTDAQLAFTCDGWQKDIHFYGDSYLGSSSDRWLYYAFSEGNKDALFDGYGGRGSGGAYASLVANLEKSSPEIVVWMMGMNDGSDTDINTPSLAWSANRDKLIALSEQYGFEIVFTTIPTVPNINHEAKNKWIRESGYRYIDMAAELGADGTGAWHEGYLASDNVHPAIRGAEAIYEAVKKGLPEFITSNEEN